MFLKALEVTGVAAAEALMIDDSEHKLTHAKALGMKTLHLTKEKDLGVELAKLGVVEW